MRMVNGTSDAKNNGATNHNFMVSRTGAVNHKSMVRRTGAENRKNMVAPLPCDLPTITT